MTTYQKVGGLAFSIIIGGPLIWIYFNNRSIDKKLSECSTYTTAPITRVYRLRGFLYAEYNYKLNGKLYKIDEGVNDYELTEWSWVYQKKLENRKYFLLKVYCHDPTIHRLIWDVYVPDTLTRIPANGWLKKPEWAKTRTK